MKQPTRYLSNVKNSAVPGTEDLRFEDIGHHYTAMSRHYGEVNSKQCDGSLPLISTTSILKDYFPSFEHKKVLIATRVLNSKNPDPKYNGCKTLEDVYSIWEKSATYGSAMHALFEDLCNIYQWEVDSDQGGLPLFNSYMDGTKEKMYFQCFLEDFGFYIKSIVPFFG